MLSISEYKRTTIYNSNLKEIDIIIYKDIKNDKYFYSHAYYISDIYKHTIYHIETPDGVCVGQSFKLDHINGKKYLIHCMALNKKDFIKFLYAHK